jgi:hypothetical protein
MYFWKGIVLIYFISKFLSKFILMKTNYLKSVQSPILLSYLFCLSLLSCQSNSNIETAEATENKEIRIAEKKYIRKSPL